MSRSTIHREPCSGTREGAGEASVAVRVGRVLSVENDMVRRVLVDAAEAWVIDGRDADRLAALGRAALPVGAELQPPKRIFFVTAKELAGAPSRRRVPLRMAGELLEARNLALIAFAGTDVVPPHNR